jgi:hypothetical protein
MALEDGTTKFDWRTAMAPSTQNEDDPMMALFAALRSACQSDDAALIEKLRSRLTGDGISVTLRELSSSVEFDDSNGLPEAAFKRQVGLYFGEVRVFEWEEEYSGFYGCMGTGWWQDCVDTNLEEDVEQVVDALEIEIPQAHVPEPPQTEEEADDA